MFSSKITEQLLQPRGRQLGRAGSLVVTVCSAHLGFLPEESICDVGDI